MVEPITVYILQMAHTDIGYTHPQEVIGRMYLDFCDRVLDLCRQTEGQPVEQRFKWTCETFWQVRNYLQQRPEREEELLYYVRAGQIEITASYLHFIDMIDADAYRRSIELAATYCRQHNLPLKSAIHSDINGWPWSIADIFAEFDIPYFCSHVHLDSATDPLGKRGSIHYMWQQDYPVGSFAPDVPVRVPRMFWWQGPAQGRVLHWLGEHYHLGNALGLSGIQPFPTHKSLFFTETDHMYAQELYQKASQALPAYLLHLRAAGYPYNLVQLSTSGFYVDNSPPDLRWCEVIERWNAEHDDIHLRTATISEWFEAFQTHYPETDLQTYPTYPVAWPDYWAHGIGSATNVIALARRTQRRRQDVISLVEQSGSQEARTCLERALEQERLSLEHTFGAWSSTAYPGSAFNAIQQTTKELTFYRADFSLDEAASRALRALRSAGEQASLSVSARSCGTGLHTVHFAAEDATLDPQKQVLHGSDGRDYPFVEEETTALTRYVAVLPLAALTVPNVFRLRDVPQTGGASASSFPMKQDIQMESGGWQLRIDARSGQLLSMYERATGREWVDSAHEYGFGQLIHERVVHPWGRRAVSNEARLLALGVAGERLKREMPDTPTFERHSFSHFQKHTTHSNPVFDEITLSGEDAHFGQVKVGWRLYHALPIIEQVLFWEKPWDALPEAAYVAFPFALTDGQVQFETGDAFFQPGSHKAGGQLSGTCSAYYTLQRAADIQASDGSRLLWLPLDAPLVMPNRIDFQHWETEPWRWNGFLASMPVNHYWHTNFASSQRGPMRLRYRFVSAQAFSEREQALKAALPVEALGWS